MSNIFLNPEVDVTVGALAIALATLLGYAVAFGLISIVNAFLHAFFHFAEDVAGFTVGWVPGVGKWIKSKIEAAEQKATGRLGDAARGLEGRVADAFHGAANQARSIGHEIEGQALAIWRLAWWMHNVVKPWLIHNTIGQLQRHDKTQTARARTTAVDLSKLRKALWGVVAALGGLNIGALLKVLFDRFRHIQKQIEALQHGYAAPGTIALPRDYAPTRERAKTAERANESVWDRIKGIERKISLPLAAGLITVVLGKLGAGWFRCSNVGRLGRGVCRMNTGLLENLLYGGTTLFGALSLEAMAEAMLDLEEAVAPIVLYGFKELRDIKE